MSGENHSEKLHRNDRDLEFRPDIVSDVQKHVNNEHESPESEHDEATDQKAAKRMAKLARNGVGQPPGKDKQLAATDEVKALDGVGKAPSKQAQQDALAEFREVNGEESESEGGESDGDGAETAPTQQTSSEETKTDNKSEQKTASKASETEERESEHEEQKDGGKQNGKPSREGAELANQLFREVNGGPSNEGAQFAMQMFREVNAGPSLQGANSAMEMFREVNGESEQGEREGGEGEEKKSGKKKGIFGALKDALGIGDNAGEGSDAKVLRTEVASSVEVKDAVQTKDENLLAPTKSNGATNDKPGAQKPGTQPTNATGAKSTEPTLDGATDHQAPVFLNPFQLALGIGPEVGFGVGLGIGIGPATDPFEQEADRIADQVMRPDQKDEHGSEEQHEQELEQLGTSAQNDPHGAQQQKQQVRDTAVRQQKQVQQKTNAQAAKISTGGSTQAARRGSAGQKKITATRAQGEQAQAAQRAAGQQKKVQKAKSIAELKTRLAESFKAKSEALKADVEAQRTELKTKLAAEKTKLADEIKGQETKLAADVAKRNTDLEKKFADRKKQIETQNKAELDKAEATSKAEQNKITTTGDAEARRIEAQGKTEAASAKQSASKNAASIRARGRQQAASLRKEEGGEARADAAIKKADADAKAAEARGAREAASKAANAHKMAEAARSKAASQVTELKGKLEATRETLRKQLADAQAQADAERAQMVTEVQKFIDTAKKEMAVKTDESNVRINQLEKDSNARIDGIETQTKKKIQQQHDDLLIKLEGPNAAAQLAKLDEETNKACAEIEKAVTQAQEGVKQEVADTQAAAARQTQERITAVQAEGKKAQDKIAAKAAETERKIDEAIKQLELKNKNALEAQDRDTKSASGKAQEELKAFGDKSVGDLKKSTEQYEKDKAAEESAAAAAKAAEEKKKTDEEKARLAEEKRKQDEAAAAEKAKKEEFARKTQGAANELFDAMDGWGTNEKKVFAALRGKSPEEMQAIKDAYKARTGRSLDADLTAEMSGNDLKEAKALLSQDPVQSRVAALQNAMQGWGTDEKKVKETLASITDPALRAKVVEEYEKQTGDRLSKALADEGMGDEGVKPDDFKSTPAGPVLDPAKVEELAKSKDVKLAVSSILGATDRWGTDEKAISAALKGKTPEEIAAIKKAFQEHSGGKSLDDVLEDELSGTELKEAKALMSGDPVRAAVAQLHDAADGLGTNTEKIHETLKGITDPELRRQVTAQYEKETGEKLDDMLEDELSGFDKDKARAYAEGNKAKIAAVEADAAMHGGFMTDIADGMADTFGVDREQMRSAVGGAILGPYAAPALNGMGVKVGTDFGTDNKALFAALEGCKDQKERDELIAAYRDRTGRDLMADVSADLEGKEKDVAKYIMAGDKASAEAAKMAAAADGMGTDRKAIFEALEKAESKAERDAMIAKYNELYGKNGETFEKMIEGELDDLDKAKAQQLAKQGRMDDGFALYYAMNEGFLGIGTDDDLLKERLAGKSKEDIEKLKREYAEAAKQYGGVENADLIEDVKGETSGRAGHDLRQAMKGNPTTLEEMRQRLAEDYAFERTESGWVGNAAMFVMNPLGYGAMQSQGINSTTIANGLTDMWSGSGQRLDQTHKDIEEKYQKILQDPRFANYNNLPPGSPERAAMDRAMMAELQGVADWQEGDLKAFEEAKDATADVASTAVTVAVGAVITIASGGTAAPAVVALLSGMAGVSTKMLIRGGSMSNEEIVQETAAVIAEAAAAGVVKIGKINQFCEKVGALAGGNNKLMGKILQEALEEAIESGSEEIINAALDPELYKGDLADWAKGVSQRTGKAMFTGAWAGGVASGFGDMIPATKTWYGRAGAAASSQAVGAVATAAIDPSTYEGSQEEKFTKFGRSVGEAAIRGARDSMGGGHGDSLGDDHYNASHAADNDNNSNNNNNNNSGTKTETSPAVTTGSEANVSTPVESSVEIQSSQEVAAPVTVANDNDISTAEDLALADAIARAKKAKAEADQKQDLEEEAAELEQAANNLEDEAAKRKAEDDSRELAWQAHEAERARLAAEADAQRKLEEQKAWEERAKGLAEQKASEEEIAWAELQAEEALADNKPVLPTANDNQPAKSLIGDKSFKTDKNNDGVQDAARVGVEGTTIPNEIPRLPGLDEKQKAAESKFADAYERDPEALAREYLEMVKSGQTDKEGKNFATDDAKLLSPDYNVADTGPVAEGQVDPKIAARGYMNIAVHQTANAVAKLAFTMRLDQIANDSSSPKKILVTAGGVGAGKSFAIDNNPQATKLKSESAAVWDSAGEQNSTELPWVIAEAQKRGIEVAIVYVHRRPDQSWENMKFGVIPRAAKTGRMVDARLHADSYAEGARNFDAVQKQMANIPGVKFVVIDATGDAPVEIDQLPQSALELDAELVHKRNVEFLESKKSELPDHVLQGGNAIGEKIWGPAATGVETKTETKTETSAETESKATESETSTETASDTKATTTETTAPTQQTLTVDEVAHIDSKTVKKASALMKRNVPVGDRTSDKAHVESVLRRLVSGDKTALADLGVSGRVDHTLTPDKLEWAVGKITTENGVEYMLIKGEQSTVNISDLPGVELVAHNHPREYDNKLTPTENGSMNIADIAKTGQGFIALFPSTADVAYSAENGQESHTIFLPYRHMGDGRLANSDADGADLGQPVEVKFINAKEVPGSNPQAWTATVQWMAGGQVIHTEPFTTAFDESGGSMKLEAAAETNVDDDAKTATPPMEKPESSDAEMKKQAEIDKAWAQLRKKQGHEQKLTDAKKKFQESKAYEHAQREAEAKRKAEMNEAWEQYESQKQQKVDLEQMNFAHSEQETAKPKKPVDFPGATPGSVPAGITPAQQAAFDEANKVFESVKANPFLGADFAKLQWARVLESHGITVESGTTDLGTRNKAFEATDLLDREAKQANNLAESTVQGDTKLVGRSKTQSNLHPDTVKAAFNEVGKTMGGFDIKQVSGNAMVIRLVNAEGKRVNYTIRLLPPDTLPAGQIAGTRIGDSANESFVWVSRDLTDDQVVRALGGIISKVVAEVGGAGQLGQAHAAEVGQLDAMMGHLETLEVEAAKPKKAATGSKIDQAVAASKAESPARVDAEIQLLLGRMGLVPSNPTFESQLAHLPSEVAGRVLSYLRRNPLNVNTSAILEDSSSIIKPEQAAETLPAKSMVLAATPEAGKIKPYTAADHVTVLELKATFEAIAEIDERLKHRDQKGTSGDRGKIGEGETLRRRDLVKQAQALMGQLQLGGSDMAYYDGRLKELEAVFPGLGAQLAPVIKAKVEDRLQSEAAHKKVVEYQQRAKQQAETIEKLVKAKDPFLSDRLVIGDGPAGLANLATLGMSKGADGFINPEDCIVIGGKDLISRMAESDSSMKWGQRAEVFDPTGDGEAHAIFRDENGKATGELQSTSEDAGDFASVGAVSDAFDLARDRMGVARVGAKVMKVELKPKDQSGWPPEASEHGARALIEFADGSTKWIYLKHVDVTAGLGSAMLPDSSILSEGDKNKMFKNGAIIGGDQIMTGKNVAGKRVLVVGYGPTGAWASMEAVKQGAVQVDWTGSSGTVASSEAGAKNNDNATALNGLKNIDRVQEAFETSSKVNTSADRILSIKSEGEGALVTFVRGKPPNEQTYTVQYDAIITTLAPSNTSKNVVGDGMANAGTLLEGINMRAQGVREDGSVAPVLESTEGGDDDGSIRVLGSAAWDNVQVKTDADSTELKTRRDDIKTRLSADSPDARVMEATSEIATNANKKSAKAAAKTQVETTTDTDSKHTDTSGTASAVEGSSFHGQHMDGQAVTVTEVTAQLKRLGHSLEALIDKTASGSTIEIDGTTLKVTLPDGEVRTIIVEMAPKATKEVASFTISELGAIIEVSPQARIADLERALAHEAAEIVALWSKTASNDSTTVHKDGLTAHDLGRQAELTVLLDQFQTMAQSQNSTNQNFGNRQDVVNEVKALLAEMGFPTDGKVTPEMEKRLGPVMTAQVRKLFFLTSPEFKSLDQGTQGGVVVHGTDTRIGKNFSPVGEGATPGHVMATDMRIVEHEGFVYDPLTNTVTNNGETVPMSSVPVEIRDVLLDKVKHVSYATTTNQIVNKGSNTGTAKVGNASPVRGMGQFPISAMPGADLGFGQDSYIWGKKAAEGLDQGLQTAQDFSYAFSKAFVPVQGFRDKAHTWREDQKKKSNQKQNYVLATAEIGNEKVGSDQRQVDIHTDSNTVQANNCATTIIDIFSGVKTVGFKGFPQEFILDEADFLMMGMNADGTFQLGRDIRPQDVYEHLRWKEQDWRRRLGEAMAKNPELDQEVLQKLGEAEYAAIKRVAGTE